jgi:hypothetical protein
MGVDLERVDVDLFKGEFWSGEQWRTFTARNLAS